MAQRPVEGAPEAWLDPPTPKTGQHSLGVRGEDRQVPTEGNQARGCRCRELCLEAGPHFRSDLSDLPTWGLRTFTRHPVA